MKPPSHLSITEDGLMTATGFKKILLWNWHTIYPTSYRLLVSQNEIKPVFKIFYIYFEHLIHSQEYRLILYVLREQIEY